MGVGGRKGVEMTQTLYAHMNKQTNKQKKEVGLQKEQFEYTNSQTSF
jgi:hypothetical protein